MIGLTNLLQIALASKNSNKMMGVPNGTIDHHRSFIQGVIMQLSAPKNITFFVAVALFLIGFIGWVAKIAFLATLAPWLIVLGFIVLALGVLLTDL
jgi:threonine/homoserine/homoserine lactone efflux protein